MEALLLEGSTSVNFCRKTNPVVKLKSCLLPLLTQSRHHAFLSDQSMTPPTSEININDQEEHSYSIALTLHSVGHKGMTPMEIPVGKEIIRIL